MDAGGWILLLAVEVARSIRDVRSHPCCSGHRSGIEVRRTQGISGRPAVLLVAHGEVSEVFDAHERIVR